MSSIRRAFLALASLAVLASPTLAAPEKTKGDVLAVDLASNKVVVKHPEGYNIVLTVAPDTPVKFTDATEVFLNPTVRDLQTGMYIWFTHENGVAHDIEVRAVSEEMKRARAARGSSGAATAGNQPGIGAGSSGGTELKARILSIDERRGEFRADVAGRSQTFRVDQPRLIRRFQEGDMVVLTVDRRGGDEVVTNVRTAGQSGRVTRVDRRRGEVAIEVDGREETYSVQDKDLLERVRQGDRVRFEFEDRSNGRKVITGIS
jgi:Cu/Ag efflux protein CusF